MTNAVEFLPEGEVIESLQRKAEKQADSAIQNKKRLAKRPFDLRLAPASCCGIGNTPMGRHRLPGPHRADLVCRVVTNGEHKVEPGRVGQGEFIPGLAASTADRDMRLVELP